MTLIQISRKYGIDYQALYQGMAFSGLIKRRSKNVDYDEAVVLSACKDYFDHRSLQYMHKMGEMNWVSNKIRDILKNGLIESPPEYLQKVP